MSIIDASRSTTSAVAGLAAAGVTAVGRYYAPATPKYKPKIITPEEARAISTANMSIFTVFESVAEPTADFATGAVHAHYAATQATAIGQPHGSAIYFAFDSDLDSDKIDGVTDYFNGVKSVIGQSYKLGVYSDGVICQAMLDAGLCQYTWLSMSRGFPGSHEFYASRRWALAQVPQLNQTLAGIGVDYNESNVDFGTFTVGANAFAAVVPQFALGAAPAAAGVGNFYTNVIAGDPRLHSTNRIADVNLLEPVTRAAVQAAVADAAQLGVDLMVFETFRSRERQAMLFDQGVTKLKQVGVHHYGLACDLVRQVDGEPNWKGDYSFLGPIARHHGLVWGGDWGQPASPHSFRDYDHVQRCTLGRQPSLFSGAWYPDAAYNPYTDGAS